MRGLTADAASIQRSLYRLECLLDAGLFENRMGYNGLSRTPILS